MPDTFYIQQLKKKAALSPVYKDYLTRAGTLVSDFHFETSAEDKRKQDLQKKTRKAKALLLKKHYETLHNAKVLKLN